MARKAIIALFIGLLIALTPSLRSAQETVTITVDANAKVGPLKPIWAYVGYDEPNYTDMKHGRKLVAELAKMNPVPVHFRAHRSEEHTSELQSLRHLVCRLLLEKKK